MSPRLSKQSHLVAEPRKRGEEERGAAAPVPQVHAGALAEKFAQDFDVRSGCREVL